MGTGGWSTTTGFRDLRERLDRLFEDFTAGSLGRLETVFTGKWSPPVDITETEREYIIRADVPGTDRDNIEITLEDGVLTICGERLAPQGMSSDMYRRMECLRGPFRRSVELLEAIDPDGIAASYRNGMLEVRAAKQERAEPRQIPVRE